MPGLTTRARVQTFRRNAGLIGRKERKVKKRIFSAMVVTTAVAGLSATAFAGFHTGQAVVISDPGMFANGDLGYVHNTADLIQYIGCSSSGSNASCMARNLAGVTRSCSTANPSLLAAIHSLSGDSHLYFGWNAAGACTFINVRNASYTEEK
jgi:hypothetical protein